MKAFVGVLAALFVFSSPALAQDDTSSCPKIEGTYTKCEARNARITIDGEMKEIHVPLFVDELTVTRRVEDGVPVFTSSNSKDMIASGETRLQKIDEPDRKGTVSTLAICSDHKLIVHEQRSTKIEGEEARHIRVQHNITALDKEGRLVTEVNQEQYEMVSPARGARSFTVLKMRVVCEPVNP